MRLLAVALPTETTPFAGTAATLVKNEFPDGAVVVEPAPNATELSALAVALAPIATAFVPTAFAPVVELGYQSQ